MRIVFLCGSLEPGRDGVGDYTRRLAAELAKRGHSTMIIALNDRHISESYIGNQVSDRTLLPVLRIPTTVTNTERFELAKVWVDKFNPEWLSLQFVPFSFHPKGLSFSLAGSLAKLGAKGRWHIMFHELWVGMNSESNIKEYLWGALQQRLILSLLKKLKPAAIHTQTKLYQLQLQRLGFKPGLLPLFSNMPVNNNSLRKADECSTPSQLRKISLVLFAGIHSGAPAQQFAKDVAVHSNQIEEQIKLIIIGRASIEQKRWADIWQSEGLPVEVLGELPPESVSAVFSNASAGITTTPFVLAEKSGAVAAMREHGLPVICVSYRWTPRGINVKQVPVGIVEYPKWDIASYLSGTNGRRTASKISDISSRFINSLLAH